MARGAAWVVHDSLRGRGMQRALEIMAVEEDVMIINLALSLGIYDYTRLMITGDRKLPTRIRTKHPLL